MRFKLSMSSVTWLTLKSEYHGLAGIKKNFSSAEQNVQQSCIFCGHILSLLDILYHEQT